MMKPQSEVAFYPDDNLSLVNRKSSERLFPTQIQSSSEISFIFESRDGSSLIRKEALQELADFEKAVFETYVDDAE